MPKTARLWIAISGSSASPALQISTILWRTHLNSRTGTASNCVDDAGLVGINQLKDLLANPLREVLEKLAKETNNPDLISKVAHERRTSGPSVPTPPPGYLNCDANWQTMIETLVHNFSARTISMQRRRKSFSSTVGSSA
jgi:hypothetical protein